MFKEYLKEEESYYIDSNETFKNTETINNKFKRLEKWQAIFILKKVFKEVTPERIKRLQKYLLFTELENSLVYVVVFHVSKQFEHEIGRKNRIISGASLIAPDDKLDPKRGFFIVVQRLIDQETKFKSIVKIIANNKKKSKKCKPIIEVDCENDDVIIIPYPICPSPTPYLDPYPYQPYWKDKFYVSDGTNTGPININTDEIVITSSTPPKTKIYW